MGPRNLVRLGLAISLLLLVAAAPPELTRGPSLALFDFIGRWQDPAGRLVDWEDMRQVPDPPAATAAAQPTAPPPAWEALPEPTRKTLEAFRAEWEKREPQARVAAAQGAQHWAGFNAQQQTMWLARFDRWSTVKAGERRALLKRFAWWSRLTVDEQRTALDGAKRTRPASQTTEARVQGGEARPVHGGGRFAEERKTWMEGLPTERRAEMAAHFKNLDRDQRRALQRKLRDMSADERKQFMRESFGKK